VDDDTEPLTPLDGDGDSDALFLVIVHRFLFTPFLATRQAYQSVTAFRTSQTAFRRAAARSSILQ
jgi:hypothetical protein